MCTNVHQYKYIQYIHYPGRSQGDDDDHDWLVRQIPPSPQACGTLFPPMWNNDAAIRSEVEANILRTGSTSLAVQSQRVTPDFG